MSARLLFCLLLTLLVLLTVGSSRAVSASPPINQYQVPSTKYQVSPPSTSHSVLGTWYSSPDWDPACYSTYAQIDTFLHNQASQYPQIATLLDGGLAWENTRHI